MKRPPSIELRYPLAWPVGRPRTASRKPALFKNDGRPLTWTTATARLTRQVNAMTQVGRDWRVLDQVLATNIRFTLQGTRDRSVSAREPSDPGVSFYFALDDRPHVLACDRWDTVYDNIAAIAAHIEALRGQERWGVADLREAFAGHAMLPAADPWWVVLGIDRAADLAAAEQAYRLRARIAHPDAGGQRAEWDRLQAAIEAARRELDR